MVYIMIKMCVFKFAVIDKQILPVTSCLFLYYNVNAYLISQGVCSHMCVKFGFKYHVKPPLE